MSEQLTAHQRIGYGARVDGDKRSGSSSAYIMDGTRNEFFTGAAFAADEKWCVAVRDRVDLFQYLVKDL
jgi:hypothetical protein